MRYREQVLKQLDDIGFTLNDKDEPVAKDGKTSQDIYNADGAGEGWWKRIQEDYAAAAVVALADIIEKLEDAKITEVDVNYAGSGDEGWIDDVILSRDGKPVEEGHFGAFAQAGSELAQAVETWAYAELERNAGGWENNEGAYGSIHLDVKTRHVAVDHNVNVETSESMPWSVSL